jgi:hypothetical protein
VPICSSKELKPYNGDSNARELFAGNAVGGRSTKGLHSPNLASVALCRSSISLLPELEARSTADSCVPFFGGRLCQYVSIRLEGQAHDRILKFFESEQFPTYGRTELSIVSLNGVPLRFAILKHRNTPPTALPLYLCNIAFSPNRRASFGFLILKYYM